MSNISSEITLNRKSGNLSEALTLCEQLISGGDMDKYELSAVFWTFRDLCKEALDNNDASGAKEYFERLTDIYDQMEGDDIADKSYNALKKRLSPNASIIAKAKEDAKNGSSLQAFDSIEGILTEKTYLSEEKDSLGWVIYYYLKENCKTIGSIKARKALKYFLDLDVEKPGILYSNILNPVVTMAETYSDFRLIDFMRLWNTKNFSFEDTHKRVFNNREYPSLRDKLMSASFRLGASVESIKEVFGVSLNFEPISQDYYYKIYNASLEGNPESSFWNTVNEYLDKVEGNLVSNEFHSKVLSSVLFKINDDNRWKFKSILQKWGFSNFRNEDWIKVKKEDMVFDSMAEKAVSTYIKAFNKNEPFPVEAESLFALAIRHDSSDESSVRALASIYMQKNDRERAFQSIKSLIKVSPSKWYLWSDIEEYINPEDIDLREAVCAKALSLQKDDNFTGKVHLKLAELLLSNGKPAEAKSECQKYISNSQKNGWKVSSEATELMGKIPSVTDTVTTDASFYEVLSRKADEIVFMDIPSMYLLYTRLAEIPTQSGKPKKRMELSGNNGVKVKVNGKLFGITGARVGSSVYEVKITESDGKKTVVYMKPSDKTKEDVLTYKPAAVDRIDKEKKTAHLVVGKGLTSWVEFNRFPSKVSPGSRYKVAFYTERKDNKTLVRVQDIVADADSSTFNNHPFVRQVKGPIRLKTNANGQDFGFVGDYYVHARLLNEIEDNDNVTITAVFNGEKWDVVSLTKADCN